MLNKTAVIGLGNSLRRDDGIGITILESLLNTCKHPGIDYLNFGTASFDLMHRMQNYNTVLLIDGINAGLASGTLKIFDLEQVNFLEKNNPISSHELNLRDIFKLTAKLEIKTKIYVAGIQVSDVGYGESLSEALEEKLEEIIKQIDKFIQEKLL